MIQFSDYFYEFSPKYLNYEWKISEFLKENSKLSQIDQSQRLFLYRSKLKQPIGESQHLKLNCWLAARSSLAHVLLSSSTDFRKLKR